MGCGDELPLSSFSVFQYRSASFIEPLWSMRAGRRLGVHFCGFEDCMASIATERRLIYAVIAVGDGFTRSRSNQDFRASVKYVKTVLVESSARL